MAKYSIGDTVEFDQTELHGTGIIKEHNGSDSYTVEVIDFFPDSEREEGWTTSRFGKPQATYWAVNESNIFQKVETKPQEFKVGDRVTVKEYCSNCYPGTEYVLMKDEDHDLKAVHSSWDIASSHGCMCRSNWVKVESTTSIQQEIIELELYIEGLKELVKPKVEPVIYQRLVTRYSTNETREQVWEDYEIPTTYVLVTNNGWNAGSNDHYLRIYKTAYGHYEVYRRKDGKKFGVENE